VANRPNNKLGRNGRHPGHTLLNPGAQPETPILKPTSIPGGVSTVYVRCLPDSVSEEFRLYCERRNYKLRHAVLCLMRWATSNNLNLAPLYKETTGTAAIHIRAVPIYTSRNFHAYCLKRGYEIRFAVAALLEWACTEDLELAGAIR
jgi:hypothetical protein